MGLKDTLVAEAGLLAVQGTPTRRGRVPWRNAKGLVEIIRHGRTNTVDDIVQTEIFGQGVPTTQLQGAPRQQVPAPVVGIGGQQLRVVAGARRHDFNAVQAPIRTLQGQRQGQPSPTRAEIQEA